MDTWTKQSSFPILSLTRANGSFRITQESFLQVKSRVDSGAAASNTSFVGDEWQIPFTYVTSEKKEMKTEWIKDRGACCLICLYYVCGFMV